MNPLIDHFFKALLILITMGIMGNSLGILMAVMSPTLEFATEFATAFNLPIIVCGGLFLNIDDIPQWLPWKWFSPARWAFEAMIRNEYDDLHDMDHKLRDDAVDDLNLAYHYWKDFWILCILFMGFRTLAALIFWAKQREK